MLTTSAEAGEKFSKCASDERGRGSVVESEKSVEGEKKTPL